MSCHLLATLCIEVDSSTHFCPLPASLYRRGIKLEPSTHTNLHFEMKIESRNSNNDGILVNLWYY